MKNKILKNASWIIGCKLIKAFLMLIITMISARYLGPSNYGLISYAASLVAFVTPIMKLGLESTLVYEIVNNPSGEGKIVGTSIAMNFISGILCLVGVCAFVFFVNAGEVETLVVCALYGLSLLFQALEMIQYWFQSKLLSKYSAMAMLISYIIVAALQTVILLTNKNIYLFCLTYSLDFLLIAILLLIIYRKMSTQKLSFSLKIGKDMLSKSKYYIISTMMVTIFAQTDKIMLKMMIDNSSVGYYTAGVTCATMFAFVFAAILDSFRPTVFEAKKESDVAFCEQMKKLYSILIYFSLVICIFSTAFSPLIIKIMYGNAYDSAIPVLRVIVWYTTFSYLGSARNIWVMAEGKQKYLWIMNLSGAILNIVLNLLLIPVYNIMGAAIASLITQIFTNVIIGFIIKPIRKNNNLMIKALDIRILKNIFLKKI